MTRPLPKPFAHPTHPDGFAQHERQASIEVVVLVAMVLATTVSIAVSMWMMHGAESPAGRVLAVFGSLAERGGS